MDPGSVATAIYRDSKLFSAQPLKWLIQNLYAPPWDGAAAVVHAASAPSWGPPARPRGQCRNPGAYSSVCHTWRSPAHVAPLRHTSPFCMIREGTAACLTEEVHHPCTGRSRKGPPVMNLQHWVRHPSEVPLHMIPEQFVPCSRGLPGVWELHQ